MALFSATSQRALSALFTPTSPCGKDIAVQGGSSGEAEALLKKKVSKCTGTLQGFLMPTVSHLPSSQPLIYPRRITYVHINQVSHSECIDLCIVCVPYPYNRSSPSHTDHITPNYVWQYCHMYFPACWSRTVSVVVTVFVFIFFLSRYFSL